MLGRTKQADGNKSERSSISPKGGSIRPISVMVDVVSHEEPSVCSIMSNGPNNNNPNSLEQVTRMFLKKNSLLFFINRSLKNQR